VIELPAGTPAETHRLWGDAFNRGDLDELMDLYEEDAVLVAQPGTVVSGLDAIREALSGFLGAKATFTLDRTDVHERDDLAIVYSKWRLEGGTGPDGNPMDVTAQTTDVLRRQQDGSWLFAIDNPWGVAAWQ
jgi:uncharacterized protein (TIGR02246 family)